MPEININSENLKRLNQFCEGFNLDLEQFINNLLRKDLDWLESHFSETIDYLNELR